MKLTAQIKLTPTTEQGQALRRTMNCVNEACAYVSGVAFTTKTYGQFALQKAVYLDVKSKFGLTAQAAVHAIKKVVDSYKKNKDTLHKFYSRGAITYDDRILSWKPDQSQISIWTLEGRQRISFVCGEKQRELLKNRQGESDLVEIDRNFYLLVTCNMEEPDPRKIGDYIGIDLGIVDIATTSDGKKMSGAKVKKLRKRHNQLRKKLQSKGTKSAHRLLKKRKRKESRFARDTNHCISKEIVAVAERTLRGIAIEDLKHIRARLRVEKPQRVMLSSWSFGQLRSFIEYKARGAGIPIVLVNPAYTSQSCPQCGNVSKRNRKTQSKFSCNVCEFSGNADVIAAKNIRMAAVNRPDAVSRVA